MAEFNQSNNIYKNLDPGLNIKLFRFNGLDIPFGLNWKKIGINLSGGADSSCLLTLLCKIITENKLTVDVHVISHVRCYNSRPWQGPIALDVFNKFVSDYPHINFIRHTNFIPPELEWGALGPITKDENGRPRSGDQIAVGSFNKYILLKEKIDAVFNATSANPDGSNWPGAMKNREKKASEGVLTDLIEIKLNHFTCHPFRFVEKSWIVAQYFIFNKLDLYSMTRSCEGDLEFHSIKKLIPSLFDYDPTKHTVYNIPKCGKCWWCLERDWAETCVDEILKTI